jgi:hypothetical protein
MALLVNWPPRRLWIPWSSAFTSSALYILTVLYASQSTILSRVRSVGGSPSHTILVLRVLSELASLSLATTIAAVFEGLQCMLVSRGKQTSGQTDGAGFELSNYLGLDSGTGILGLLGMALGRRVSKITTRSWSIIRLVAIVMIPLLNILIMGKSLLLLQFGDFRSQLKRIFRIIIILQKVHLTRSDLR